MSDLLVDVFPAAKFELFNTATCDEARRLADQHGFDLAIVDPSIPHGFPFIQFLRSKETTKVIALTNSQIVLEKVRAQGMEQVIDKKSGLNGLVVAIRNLGFDVAVPGREQVGILVVDDTPDIRDLLTFFLRDHGYAVTAAASGKEALDVLDSDPTISLVVLDIIMPEMGGVDVLKELRKRNSKLAVVMCSAIHDSEIAAHARDLGAFDYVLKPVDLMALETTIIAALTHVEYKNQPWWKRIGA